MAAFRRQRFLQEKRDAHQAGHPEYDDDPERGSPTGMHDQISADDRRDDRRDADHQHQERKNARGFARSEVIADHGARDQHGSAAADGLKKARAS